MRIAFDIGNVLFRIDLSVFTDRALEFGIQDGFGFLEEVQISQDLGLYSMRQALAKCISNDCHHPEKEERIQILERAWLETIKTSDLMVDFIDKLIGSGHEIALLSNIGIDHRDLVLKRAPILNKCSHKIFSCEIGARKPCKLFFQSFLLQAGWEAPILYFDDRPENFSYLGGGWDCVQFNLCDYDTDEEGLDILKREITKRGSLELNTT